jgi:hypothetical protein
MKKSALTAVEETMMRLFFRHTVLILLMWLMAAGVCYGKQVYLQDGGIIDAQSAWRHGNKVFVKVNRDIVAEFNPNEIDLRRTFPGSASPSRHLKRTVSAADKSTVPKHAAAAVAPPPKPAVKATPPVSPPAPKPAASPVPATPPNAKEPAQPVLTPLPPTDPASPPDKAELQQRAQEAAKMMAEAVMKKDPELIKKALEMQKSAMLQQGTAGQKRPGFPLFLMLIILTVCILIIAAQWIVFQKAGQAGWKCLIPFYNIYVLMEISGKPGWWMFLLIIPLVGVAVYLFAMLSLAKKFGRGELFGVGIFFLPMIFFPLLAFGGSEYEG